MPIELANIVADLMLGLDVQDWKGRFAAHVPTSRSLVYPQLVFSLASRTTKSRIYCGFGGRPGSAGAAT